MTIIINEPKLQQLSTVSTYSVLTAHEAQLVWTRASCSFAAALVHRDFRECSCEAFSGSTECQLSVSKDPNHKKGWIKEKSKGALNI